MIAATHSSAKAGADPHAFATSRGGAEPLALQNEATSSSLDIVLAPQSVNLVRGRWEHDA